MSESPASSTAMVEQRKSFPQAVPSSIYISISLIGSPGFPSENPIAEQLHSPKWSCTPSSQSSGADLQLRRLEKVSRMGSTYVVAVEVVYRSLSKHGVVFELRLAQGWTVGGDEDQFSLAGAEGLHGGFVAHGHLVWLVVKSMLKLEDSPLPDFMTSARREEMLSLDFLVLAIVEKSD